ncbi:hypothetical protein C5S32_06820 [ANME-1 cluster archaeon GoMg1]|nr:hypothetical protein [ANME-1 cluster archaeon GoMg1]
MKKLFGASVSLSRNWEKGKGYQFMSGERKRSQSFLCEQEEEKLNWSINTEESCTPFKMSLLAFVSNVEAKVAKEIEQRILTKEKWDKTISVPVDVLPEEIAV